MPAVKPASQASGGRPAEKAFRQLVRTFGLLERVMQPYFARFGISGAQWGVLRTLHRAEEAGRSGLRLSELGEQLLIRPPSVTGVVDRLQRAGLVRRVNVASDLRARLVLLTPKGRELLEKVLEGHVGQVSRVMGGLEETQQEHLHELLIRLGEHLQGLAAGPEGEAEGR
jgi:DNA-binding MarR family transcriptional regulator